MISPGGRPIDESPFSASTTDNWVARTGGLPSYIRGVAHALVRDGHTESEAIQLAVAAMKRWAAGADGVHPAVRAAAAAALAEWEAKRGAAHALSTPTSEAIELARPMSAHRRNLALTMQSHLDKARALRKTGDHKGAAVHYRIARSIKRSMSGAAPTVSLSNALPPLKKGGAPRFPIKTPKDVESAVKLVGLAKGNKQVIRRHIVTQAKKVGGASKIPDDWNADGTVKVSSSTKTANTATQASSTTSTSKPKFGSAAWDAKYGIKRFTKGSK